MNIGVMCSSAGSVFRELYNATKHGDIRFFVATDRECPVEDFCTQNDINLLKIRSTDNTVISSLSADFFNKNHVDIVLLFFLRLVTEEVYSRFPTFNIHPSLLPSFPGFNPLEKALKSNCPYFGTTLHLVDNSVDCGPIVAQAVYPFSRAQDIELIYKISFLQKTYCALLLIDSLLHDDLDIAKGNKYVIWNNPNYHSFSVQPSMHKRELLSHFLRLQEKEGYNIIL